MTEYKSISAEALARRLMAGNPRAFKAGFSAESAVVAVAKERKLDLAAAEDLAAAVGADWKLVRAVLESAR